MNEFIDGASTSSCDKLFQRLTLLTDLCEKKYPAQKISKSPSTSLFNTYCCLDLVILRCGGVCFVLNTVQRMAENNDNSANMITVVVRSPKESKDIVISGRDTVKQVDRTCLQGVIFRENSRKLD